MKALNCGALLLGCLAACNGSPAAEPGDEGEVGRIRVALSAPGPTYDVAAIHVKVVEGWSGDCSAEAVAEATIGLEEEGLPLHPDLLPPGAGENHAFGDALFVVTPGLYWACATPLTESGAPSAHCRTSGGGIEVLPGLTSEMGLYSHCSSEQSGGLDVFVALNSAPQIDGVVIEESKFITTCEEATITASASDPDGDNVYYQWFHFSGPARPTIRYIGSTATFRAGVEGVYQVRLVAFDRSGFSSSLTFPIHVSYEEGCEGSTGAAEVCESGTDIGSGAPWVVCAADEDTAWVSASAEGDYHIDIICQQLGYSAAVAYGSTCGSVCGRCETEVTSCESPGERSFDGTGYCGLDELGRVFCRTVQWECVH
ncbi:hypothetical protein [Sorangium sp. So ce233]|uniref:hypothetical protein n=1 Tax=Sorangium sp. So ce233 TaxID=3133290 RepID=UPI003F642CF5